MKVINELKKNQFFWNVLEKVFYFYPTALLTKIPNSILIEPTNSCNLRCPVCPTHFAMKRKRGFMSYDLFKGIIDDLKDIKDKPSIVMVFAGEPLLNKDVPKFVSYASKRGHKTYISTNATFLDKQLSEDLIQAGLTSIHLCMDGITKESQEAYRVGSIFEEVKTNIENFLIIRDELRPKKLSAILQVLLTSFSENEIDEIINWAKKIGIDEINFKSLSMGSYTTPEIKKKYNYLLPKNKDYQRKTSNIYKTICRTPLDQAVVFWNGDLGLCCIDFDSSTNLPNIKERGFKKTFTSKEVRKIRKMGLRKKYTLCKKCSFGNADNMGFDVRLSQK